MEPTIEEMNIAIAEFEGYRLHTQVHLQDWDTFRGEPDPIDKIADVVSLHEVLQYKDNEAPEHWGLPRVVAEYETEVIPVADLDYHTNWNSAIRVARKAVSTLVNMEEIDSAEGVQDAVATLDINTLHRELYLVTQFIKTQHGT